MEVKKKIGVWCALFALLVALVPPGSAKAAYARDTLGYDAQTHTLQYTPSGSTTRIVQLDGVLLERIKSSAYVTFVYTDLDYVHIYNYPKEYSAYFVKNKNYPAQSYIYFLGADGGYLKYNQTHDIYYRYYRINDSTGFMKMSTEGVLSNMVTHNAGNSGHYTRSTLESEWKPENFLYANCKIMYYDSNDYLIGKADPVDIGEVLAPILRFITNFFEYSFVAFGYEISIGAIVIFSIMGGMLISFMRR